MRVLHAAVWDLMSREVDVEGFKEGGKIARLLGICANFKQHLPLVFFFPLESSSHG